MKRFKLSTQLVFLFIIIFGITGVLFSVLVGSKLGDFSESSTLTRLSSMIDASRMYWDDSSNQDFVLQSNKIDVAYVRLVKYSPSNGMVFTVEYPSDNLNDVISNNDLSRLLGSIPKAPNSSGSYVKTFHDSGKVFCSYEISESGNGIIIITDSKYATSLKNKMTLEVLYIFIIILLFSACIIFLWSKAYTTRLYRLNTHVKNLPKNNYDGEYLDDGLDEISDLSKTIEGMRTELKNTEKDKREMLQNLSHDFKTPIAVIKSYAEAMEEGIEGKEGLDVIIQQSELLQSKVAKLLQYNRLEYLNKDKEFENVHISDVINNVIKTYKHQNQLEIKLDLDETITFLGYEENYYTVIDNILDNAKRYAKTTISITLKNNELIIYNDGDHIDEKFINGLFKAYEKGSKGQFGLGMSIVKKTLDFFGYDLFVKNEQIGVSFTIKRKENSNILAL